MIRDGYSIEETKYADNFLYEFLATNSTVGGVDSAHFSWAQSFLTNEKDPSKGGRNILLSYGEYRVNISLFVLEAFKDNSIVVYELPAHTSRNYQALYVVVISEFKNELNTLTN